MRVAVPPELAGERADKVVAVLVGVSRSVARRMVEEGRARGEDAALDPRERLAAGRWLVLQSPPPPVPLQPEEVPFAVRFEDEHLVVVDKPAGVVVHPGAGTSTGTLAGGLLARYPDLVGVGDEGRWGIVHRLDRETSGLLVVARTATAHRALRRQLSARRMGRHYLALVHGAPPLPTGTVDAPIGRAPGTPRRMAVRADGRPARSHYRLQAGWEEPRLSLLEVTLESGRTHQVRVHLASIGLPVVGDRVYGRRGPPEVDPGRVWLHAVRLAFEHPVTGDPLLVEAPLPAELNSSLAALGPPATGQLEGVIR